LRTDPELIARVASEIDHRFAGAKVRDVGRLPDGRVALVLWARGTEQTLCIDVFSTPPLISLESHELSIESEPGFIRAIGTALRGSTLIAAKARKDDRLVRLTFGTRSRFGVGDESDLYVELVPRFGNVVLVRKERIVAALKEFSLAENGTRAIQGGQPYALPPLPTRRSDVETSSVAGDASVLEHFTAYRAAAADAGNARRAQQRRDALLKKLDERERKARRELDAVAEKQRAAQDREALRERGDAIYARLHEFGDEAAREEAKAEAAALFTRYKKLGASLVHLKEREAALGAIIASVEQLRYDGEHADDVDLGDVEDAFAQLDSRGRTTRPAMRRRKRAPLEVTTATGSRILVGRSPSENAELTFRVAKPDDWWFHAQNVPGAHVILQRHDRSEPPPDDLERAAALAAFFSKARASAKVPIDYTRRKYVRAQRNAPPGLVWYTNPRTLIVTPEGP